MTNEAAEAQAASQREDAQTPANGAAPPERDYPIIEPTIGRIVLVKSGRRPGHEWPAIITGVRTYPEGLEGDNPRHIVELMAFCSRGDIENASRPAGDPPRYAMTLYHNPKGERPDDAPYAEWMPYQRGQAQKNDELVSSLMKQVGFLEQALADMKYDTDSKRRENDLSISTLAKRDEDLRDSIGERYNEICQTRNEISRMGTQIARQHKLIEALAIRADVSEEIIKRDNGLLSSGIVPKLDKLWNMVEDLGTDINARGVKNSSVLNALAERITRLEHRLSEPAHVGPSLTHTDIRTAPPEGVPVPPPPNQDPFEAKIPGTGKKIVNEHGDRLGRIIYDQTVLQGFIRSGNPWESLAQNEKDGWIRIAGQLVMTAAEI